MGEGGGWGVFVFLDSLDLLDRRGVHLCWTWTMLLMILIMMIMLSWNVSLEPMRTVSSV